MFVSCTFKKKGMMTSRFLSLLLLMMLIIGMLGGGSSSAAAATATAETGGVAGTKDGIDEMMMMMEEEEYGGKAGEEEDPRRLTVETEIVEQELVFDVLPSPPRGIIDVTVNVLSNVLGGLRSALRTLALPIYQPAVYFARPEQFPDGQVVSDEQFFIDFPNLAQFYNRDGTRPPRIRDNAYAWASDYNETCNLGMMIHSGGTGLYASSRSTSNSAPRITFRDDNGEIVYQDYVWESLGETIDAETYPLLGTGIRTGRIVNCEGDLITIVIGVNSRLEFEDPGSFGDIRRMTIDLSKEGPEAVSNYAITPIRAPSVRTTFQNGCLMTFAPLFDVRPEAALVDCATKPILLTYDWCSATTPTEDPAPPTDEDTPCGVGDRPARRLVQVVDIEDDIEGEEGTTTTTNRHRLEEELPGALIWDFECEQEFDTCWISLYDHQFDETKLGGVDVFPNLYWFLKSDLAQDITQDSNVQLHRVELNMNVDTGAHTMHHIDEDRVLACGLASFVYYIDASENGLTQDVDLSAVELGNPQECMVCSKQTNACTQVPINPPSTQSKFTNLTPYIWQAEKCGDYMFIGTLDINQLTDGVVYGLVEELGLDDLEPIPLIWLLSLLKGLYFEQTVTPYDNGFDLWYIPLSDLDNPALNTFLPVTVNGFRRAEEAVNLGGEWPFEFAPDTPQEDGVRQLMCHNDQYLMIGTTVRGFGQSSSTWVLDTQDTLPFPVAVPPIRPSYFAILGSGLNQVIANFGGLTAIVTVGFQGLVGGFQALAGQLPEV